MSQTLDRHDLVWAVRIMPKPVRELMIEQGPRLMAAGGFIRSCVLGEKPNDLDLFVASKKTAEEFAATLAGRKKFITTDNALTIPRLGARYSTQIIHRWTFDTPKAMLDSFDFTIASAAIWFEGGEWRSMCHERFYADLAAKRLVYMSPQRNEDAGGSILRTLKFYQRGFRIPLDSLGAVIARLVVDVDIKGTEVMSETGGTSIGRTPEERWAKILTGLLREVDPQIDPDHISHLPTLPESNAISIS